MKADANVPNILKKDGISLSFFDAANQEVLDLKNLIDKYGRDKSWSHTVIDTKSNSATLICQMPGEGNRKHYHPDWDEWWYIVEGEWDWWIEGTIKRIKQGSVVFIERNRKHKITAAGNRSAIRLAVSRYDVDHVYEPGDY